MALFNGSCEDVEEALKQFGTPGLDFQDMDMYDLKAPTAVTSEARGGRDVITMEAKAGMTIRTYVLHWENGQIVQVEDKGMR